MITDEKSETGHIRAEHCGDAAIDEFIRTHGVTRCPTACVVPTQGSVPPRDQAELNAYAESRDRLRRARAARRLSFSPLFETRPAR